MGVKDCTEDVRQEDEVKIFKSRQEYETMMRDSLKKYNTVGLNYDV